MADNLGYSIFMEPTDVVRAFETRGELRPTVRWSEMMHENHAVAFTVAKIAKLDLLRSMHTSIGDVIRNGGTFEEWKSGIMPELQKAGWWGAVSNRELTGTDETIIVNNRRLRTIYNTNVRMSMASGHWQRIQRQKDVMPYLRYLPSTSEHKRPLHMSWYGILLPVDHPFWQTHFPPNGWGCKCHFEQVTERRMKRMGWKVTPDSDLPQGAQQFFPAAGGAIMVPDGIDPGFSYNPGTAHLRAIAAKTVTSMRDATDAGMEAVADTTLREIVADPAFDQFLALPRGAFPVAILDRSQQQAIGATARVVVMPEGVMRKQLGVMPGVSSGHPELTADNYRLLPDIVSRALVVAQQGTNRLIYFSDASGNIWKAVVRQDVGDALPVLVSFHRSRERNIQPETKNLTILVDRR
ncbi:phage minor head protein [Sphingobium aromaticiconvertens]|uniref:phage head morphogenesis protein n=1 Tax=Sphingobium aromaticiconvertens TaxID=365341 RepID=UPI00301A4135